MRSKAVIVSAQFITQHFHTLFEGDICMDCVARRTDFYDGTEPYVDVTNETTCEECGIKAGEYYHDKA